MVHENMIQTGPNRHLGLFTAMVNLQHMKEQYDWAAGRVEEALLRFADNIPMLESEGSHFSVKLRELQTLKKRVKNGTEHNLIDCWGEEQTAKLDCLLETIGYGSRGGYGFFNQPDYNEDMIEAAVKEGVIYQKKGILYVTPHKSTLPCSYLFRVRDPFERLATDLEQRIPWIAQEIENFRGGY